MLIINKHEYGVFIELLFQKNKINLKLFQQELVKIELAARFFVGKMKFFSLKRRLEESDFENDLETFSPPVNGRVDKVASDLSEYLITTANQPAKRKNKQLKKDPLHLKKIW